MPDSLLYNSFVSTLKSQAIYAVALTLFGSAFRTWAWWYLSKNTDDSDREDLHDLKNFMTKFDKEFNWGLLSLESLNYIFLSYIIHEGTTDKLSSYAAQVGLSWVSWCVFYYGMVCVQ